MTELVPQILIPCWLYKLRIPEMSQQEGKEGEEEENDIAFLGEVLQSVGNCIFKSRKEGETSGNLAKGRGSSDILNWHAERIKLLITLYFLKFSLP